MRRVALGLWACLVSGSAWADEFVATVVGVDGSVRVKLASGQIVPLDRNDGLSVADTVLTGDDGVVVLLLRNDRVVRLDEEIELRVGDLAQLNAGPATASVDAQLAALVTTSERSDLGFREERLAGWHARDAAGLSVPSMPARPGATAAGPATARIEAPSPAPPPPPVLIQPSSWDAAPAKKTSTDDVELDAASDGLGLEGSGAGGGGMAPIGMGLSASDLPYRGKSVEWLERRLERLTSGDRCLAAWAGDGAGAVPVSVEVDLDGRIVRVFAGDGAASMPDCATEAFAGRYLAVAPGSVVDLSVSTAGAARE